MARCGSAVLCALPLCREGLFADDHPLFRDGLRVLLESDEERLGTDK